MTEPWFKLYERAYARRIAREAEVLALPSVEVSVADEGDDTKVIVVDGVPESRWRAALTAGRDFITGIVKGRR